MIIYTNFFVLASLETASDQSDIEGRIRALSDSLKKRKVEADKLRKQQKRLYREKLKAQEASLKKQLEVLFSTQLLRIYLFHFEILN